LAPWFGLEAGRWRPFETVPIGAVGVTLSAAAEASVHGRRKRSGPDPTPRSLGPSYGGIAGPLYFGGLIEKATAGKGITGLAPGYYVGAILMLAAGIIAIFLGVHAEPKSLESIAKPLTAEEDSPASGQEKSRTTV
jgi:hypothetical protein